MAGKNRGAPQLHWHDLSNEHIGITEQRAETMNITDILILFTLMLALAALPSTSVALVVVQSATAGFKQGAAVTCGIVVGDLIFVLLAIVGLTALADAMGSLFALFRYLAGGYLIWFGISLLRTAHSTQATTKHSFASSLSTSFLSGLLITLGDIKAILFYASLFPTFVDLTAIGTYELLAIMAITVVSVGGVKLGYAFAAQKILTFRFRAQRAAKITAGSIIVGAGTYLIVK